MRRIFDDGAGGRRHRRVRKVNRERRAFSDDAFDAHVTTPLMHDALDHREPETRTVSDPLAPEERLKDLPEGDFKDSRGRVGHDEDEALYRRQRRILTKTDSHDPRLHGGPSPI